MAAANAELHSEEQIWTWLADVPDPEIPVVSVVDLGMVRKVNIAEGVVEVEVSPTYSGCPATEVIEDSIISKLRDEGDSGGFRKAGTVTALDD